MMACMLHLQKLLAAFLVTIYIEGQGLCQDNVLLTDGNVTLGAMFMINKLDNGACGGVEVSSLQEVVAVTWLLDSLNAENYIPGVKIGLEAVRTCSLPERAVKGAMGLVTNYTLDKTTVPFFGLFGPQLTAEAIAVSRFLGSLPTEQRLLQVSGSATGKELSDRTLHSNFFRVIPPDTIQVHVMVELLQQLDWNYVAIVYDGDDYGRSAATELRRLAEGRQICVPLFESMPVDTGSRSFSVSIKLIINKMKNPGLISGLVIIGGSLTSSQLIEQLSSEAKFVRVILSEAIALQASALKTLSVSRGAFLTSPQCFDVPEFRMFWIKLWTDIITFTDMASRNPWLASYFRTLAGCDVVAASCWESTKSKRLDEIVSDGGANGEGTSLYIWYNLKATGVMAALLKRLHSNLCGASSSGMCPQLADFITKRVGLIDELQRSNISLSNMSAIVARFANLTDLKFDASGVTLPQPGLSQYTVYNFQADDTKKFVFKQVGVLSANNLTLDVNQVRFYNESGTPLSWSQMTPAQCEVHHDCAECQRDVSSDVIFVPGDFYIVAMISIHSKHTTNSLKCGDLRTQAGADLAEAIIFAVKEANKKSGIFRNVLPNRRVGLLVINSCSSPLLVRQRLLDLHSGRMTLPDGRNTSFLIPYVMGYVGAYTSDCSMAAASTLTDIEHTFVQVSVESTSIELKDRTKYPYFMRLVPADDTQAKVLLKLLEELGASYFQVIYDSTTAYATGLFKDIQDEINTGKYDVCVAQGIPTVPRDESSQYRWIIDRLRNVPSARTVIMILHLEEINKTLDAIVRLMTSNDGFTFLSTDEWGRRQFLIDNRPKLEGSLVLSQEIAEDKAFEKYVESVDAESSVNSLLKYFWEKRLNCYFDKSFLREGKSERCPQKHAYVQDFRAPLYINAVYSLVLGFSQVLSTHCGNSTTRKCEAVTSAKLVEAMKQVKLDLYSTGRQNDVFDSNGDGLVGFKVLQVTRDLSSTGDSVIYKDVGDWKQESGLRLMKNDLQLPHGFKSACPNAAECNKCFRPSNGSLVNNSATGVVIPLGVAIGVGIGLIVIIIALVIALIISCRRPRSKKGAWAVRFTNGPQLDRPLPTPCTIQEESSPYDLATDFPQIRSNDREYPYLNPSSH